MGFEHSLAEYALLTEKQLGRYILRDCRGGEADLREAMAYSVLGGGKRLRAYLTICFCELCGGSRDNAIDYSCAIEMIHAFSLIHDDLPAMDNDDLRRGKPSNHKKFGEATAILAGDALGLDSFAIVAGNKQTSDRQNAEAVLHISRSTGASGMCGGQQNDLSAEGKQLTTDELLRLVDMKTGVLISCACVLGCIAADAEQGFKQAASEFGILCGRAFQITDDLLDISSDAAILGKTVGKDEKSHKSTFPAVLGLSPAREYARKCVEEAKKQLSIFPHTAMRDELFEFCDFILTRNK